jgi:hypothetical protein
MMFVATTAVTDAAKIASAQTGVSSHLRLKKQAKRRHRLSLGVPSDNVREAYLTGAHTPEVT